MKGPSPHEKKHKRAWTTYYLLDSYETRVLRNQSPHAYCFLMGWMLSTPVRFVLKKAIEKHFQGVTRQQ